MGEAVCLEQKVPFCPRKGRWVLQSGVRGPWGCCSKLGTKRSRTSTWEPLVLRSSSLGRIIEETTYTGQIFLLQTWHGQVKGCLKVSHVLLNSSAACFFWQQWAFSCSEQIPLIFGGKTTFFSGNIGARNGMRFLGRQTAILWKVWERGNLWFSHIQYSYSGHSNTAGEWRPSSGLTPSVCPGHHVDGGNIK